MSNPKISIIVPVYKAEKYLHRCVDSILAQTFTDFELLLIDDGSPDSSGEICDQYAVSDQRVRVFHKPNGGVSSARNVGIDNAKGEWLMFVDADDTITKDLFQKASKHFCDCQIIKFGFNCISQHTNSIIDSRLEKQLNTIEEYRCLILSRDLIVASWSAMFNRNLIFGNDIRFNESIRNGEDWLFLLHSIFLAEHVTTIGFIGYNYYVGGKDACSTSLNAQKIIDSFNAYNSAVKFAEGFKKYDYFAKRGFCNLLNYSVSNFGYQNCSISRFIEERGLITHTIPFCLKSFCYSNYSKTAYLKITLFYSRILSFCLFFGYKLKHILK